MLTLVWSEFGRRPKQNDSGGTDHGAGGVAWVQGTRVAGGVLSDYPDLTKLDSEDNLAVTVDFRRVYCQPARAVAWHRRHPGDPERGLAAAG